MDQIGLNSTSERIVATAIVAHKKSLRKSRTTWHRYFHTLAIPGVGLPNTFQVVSSSAYKQVLYDVLKTGDWLPD